MANGFKILWTDNALEELKATYEYLESNFTKKRNLKIINLKTSRLFQRSLITQRTTTQIFKKT